jgi:hypothetical protein
MSGDEAKAQDAGTRDSAGIQIVEYPALKTAERAPLRISARPITQIGVQSGDPNQQFNRITDAALLSDGTIVVADRGSAQIRFFDRTGRFIRKLGREGQGPGEFRQLTHLNVAHGDSLVAWDAIGSRFTVFTPSGGVARTFSPKGGPPSRTVTVVDGLAADGAFFGYRTTREPPPLREAITRDTLTMAVFTRDGEYVRDVGIFLGHETRQHAGGRGVGPSGAMANMWSVKGVPFARETYFQTSRDLLYVGDGMTYQIRAYDRAGALTRIIRVRNEPRSVTPQMIDRFRSERSRIHAQRGPRVDPKVSRELFPKVLPAYAALRIDGAQRLWVQDYPAPGQNAGEWSVFARDGKYLGRVTTPRDLEVLHIGTAHVIGIWRDELDVEYVRVYPILPPP